MRHLPAFSLPLPKLSEAARRGLVAACFGVALGAAAWRIPQPAPAAFVAPAAPRSAALPAEFASELLPVGTAEPRQPSLSELADGRLAAAWLAGDTNDAAAPAIWFSLRGRDGWHRPQAIASRERTAGGTFAHVDQLGHPLLHAEGGWLHLWYESTTPLGGNLLIYSRSTDSGASWSKPRRLQSAALAGGSDRLAGPPLALADGGLALPLTQQTLGAHGAWLRLAATGNIVAKQRLAQTAPAGQPAIVALDAQHALALQPAAQALLGQIQSAHSADAGSTWQAGAALPLASPGTPLALLRLADGRLLLAGNPASGRGSLQLWLSTDRGATWQASRMLENAADGAADFSAPALLQGRDGRIHLAYAWRRQGIRHASFSPAWLDGDQP